MMQLPACERILFEEFVFAVDGVNHVDKYGMNVLISYIMEKIEPMSREIVLSMI